jgi:hypothetical protein
VISVNTGRGQDADWAGKLGRTAIDKRPAAGRVEVGRLGLGGDEQVDKPAHGGPEQALYAYAREDLDWWVEQLGRELGSGMFGENITTAGLDVTGAPRRAGHDRGVDGRLLRGRRADAAAAAGERPGPGVGLHRARRARAGRSRLMRRAPSPSGRVPARR